MNGKGRTGKDKLLSLHVGEMARDAVDKFLEELDNRVERDVQNRLKHLGASAQQERVPKGIEPAKCGTVLASEDISRELLPVFKQHFQDALNARSSGDLTSALWHFGCCVRLRVPAAYQKIAAREYNKTKTMLSE